MGEVISKGLGFSICTIGTLELGIADFAATFDGRTDGLQEHKSWKLKLSQARPCFWRQSTADKKGKVTHLHNIAG